MTMPNPDDDVGDITDGEGDDGTVKLDKGNFEELMVAMLQDIKQDLEELKEEQK